MVGGCPSGRITPSFVEEAPNANTCRLVGGLCQVSVHHHGMAGEALLAQPGLKVLGAVEVNNTLASAVELSWLESTCSVASVFVRAKCSVPVSEASGVLLQGKGWVPCNNLVRLAVLPSYVTHCQGCCFDFRVAGCELRHPWTLSFSACKGGLAGLLVTGV